MNWLKLLTIDTVISANPFCLILFYAVVQKRIPLLPNDLVINYNFNDYAFAAIAGLTLYRYVARILVKLIKNENIDNLSDIKYHLIWLISSFITFIFSVVNKAYDFDSIENGKLKYLIVLIVGYQINAFIQLKIVKLLKNYFNQETINN